MRILVTGSSGYLGRSFIRAYKNQYQFVNFSLQQRAIEKIDFTGVDTVLHAAALVHQKIDHPYEKYYEINVAYPLSLAKRAKEHGVREFVFISSIAVYGEEVTYIDEHTSPNPSTHYGKSKLQAEKELQLLQDENFIISIIRPPMIYGYQAPGNIQSLLSLIQKTPLLPLGGIENRRSFIYIKNLTALIHRVIQSQKEGIFLVSDDHSISTTELIKSLALAQNKKIYLPKIPLFSRLLQILKPKIYTRLYDNLEINNQKSREILDFITPYETKKALIDAYS
jgi:UDP-glucose 4-epimerase